MFLLFLTCTTRKRMKALCSPKLCVLPKRRILVDKIVFIVCLSYVYPLSSIVEPSTCHLVVSGKFLNFPHLLSFPFNSPWCQTHPGVKGPTEAVANSHNSMQGESCQRQTMNSDPLSRKSRPPSRKAVNYPEKFCRIFEGMSAPASPTSLTF